MIYDIQKASLTKRLSAFLFDFVIMSILVTGCMLMLSVLLDYDGYSTKLEDRLIQIQEDHKIPSLEAKHKITLNDYQYMTEEEQKALPSELTVSFDACIKALNTDSEVAKLYAIITNLSLIILSFSILLAYFVLEFAVPLIFKNGQTLGKKIFSLAIIRTDCVAISPMVLFIRTILGKYTVSTMVPVFMLLSLLFGAAPIMPLTVILLVLLLQVVFLATSKTCSLIHDVLASTVVVDIQSQMIFDSVEAKEAYKLRLHEEKSTDFDENSKY
jgi:uncharacterized RDD family membrane protein YckC